MKYILPVFLLFLLQVVGALLFLFNILSGYLGWPDHPIAWTVFELIEIIAALGLLIGAFVSGAMLIGTMRARDKAEKSLRLASSAFAEIVSERFTEWKLTPAERDVALFTIKGMSTADVATLRNTSGGTVKAQTNSIYRKAGVAGRGQLQALFLEDLMDDDFSERVATKKQDVPE